MIGSVGGYVYASGENTIRATKIELTTATGVTKAVIQVRKDGKAGFEVTDRSGNVLATIP